MKKFNYKKWILEHKKSLAEKVKPDSEKQDKLPDGRTVTRYTAISPKGKETPMISYDDNLEGPGDKKDLNPPTDKKSDDKEKTEDPKKFPFIGPKGKEFEVKMFDISPEATKLYTELQNITFKNKPDLLRVLKFAAIQHEILFIIEKTALDDKSASKAQIKCAEDTIQKIKKFAGEMGKENEHNYLETRVNSIKKIYQENPREDKNDDCPDVKTLNNKDSDSNRLRLSKQSTTYGPSNPAPRYSEGLKKVASELGYLKEIDLNAVSYEKVTFIYTEQGGRFYGLDVYENKDQDQRSAKLRYDEANEWLKDTLAYIHEGDLIPRRYNSGLEDLDLIVKRLEELGIEASHGDYMDVS